MGFRDDRLEFLRGFDVLVLPSALEGIPRCLMEAMAAGVPVVGTNIPGIKDLIGQNEYGRMFSVGDQAGLTELIKTTCSEKKMSKEISRKARKRIEEYSASKMAKHYYREYSKLTSRDLL